MAKCHFYLAALKMGPRPDYGRLAGQLNLLSGEEVRIMAGRAKVSGDGAKAYVPVRMGVTDRIGGGQPAAARRLLEGAVSAEVAAFKAVAPGKADEKALRWMAALSGEDAGRRISASDLAPLREGARTLVGLLPQQELLDDVVRACEAYGRDSLPAIGFAFTGPPGTGKTEMARSLLQKLDKAGVTDGTGNLVEAPASSLVGKYVGHTAPRVKAVVERSVGGCLLIDEAYALCDVGNDGGGEVVSLLCEQLDAHKGDVIPILCGYEEEIEEGLFKVNPGLRSRIPYHVRFDGYSDSELGDIFKAFAREKGFALAEDAEGCLRGAMGRLRGQEGFAQARTVRNFYQNTVLELAKGGGRTIGASHLEAALGRSARSAARGRAVRPMGFTA